MVGGEKSLKPGGDCLVGLVKHLIWENLVTDEYQIRC